MRRERVEFTIRTDGIVEERVEGVPGPACELRTEPFEEKLGEITERVHTAEYILRPMHEPKQLREQEEASEEEAPA